MRLHEILTEDQILAEAILTEFDWNKLKKGLATGLITLSALGIAGNALAADGKTYTASEVKNMSVSDIKNFVVKQVQQGNTDTSTVQAAVQQPKAASLDNKPEAKPKAAEPKQDVKPEIKKDEPKKAAPDELDTVKKNAGIEKSKSGNLSSFSIKGLQFGMSLEQVVGITKARETDHDAYYADQKDRFKDPDYLKKPIKVASDYKKPAGSWSKALDDFTIAGYSGWNTLTSDGPSWKTYSTSATLEGMYKTISPEDFEDIVSKFTKQYGKPNIDRSGVRNKMNYSDVNITATWKVKDTTIYIEKYSGKFTEGIIMIASDKYYANSDARSKSKKDKASKDF